MPDRYLGRQIGKYRVIRLLGAGAFAWVYEAIDRDLEIPVALKILRPEFAGQEAAEARFRREASTAAKLRHPNIVTVRDVGQVDGAAFVAMDLHPLSLARRLELVSRLPEPEVVRVGLDVAAALAIAHAGGVIHRDIKPDNILIGPHGEAVVADFGLARALSNDASLSATNQVMGTPHYFSPEQARGQEIDGRSDLYSLGVTLYRALTGKLPFEGDDWYEVAKQHVESDVTPPSTLVPDITPAFETILLRLLAKKPEERFGTAVQLADALATLPTAPIERGSSMTPHSASRTVIETAPASYSTMLRVRRRNRTLLAAGALALASLGVWGAMQRGLLGGVVSAVTPGGAAGTTDSLPPGTDSGPSLGDTVTRVAVDTPAVVAGATPVEAPRPPRPANVRVPVTFVARERANLYVNGTLVDSTGRWVGELPPTAQVQFRAVIRDVSQIECRSAAWDSTDRVSAGKPMRIEAPVRSCVTVTFDMRKDEGRVRALESEVVFEPLDGGMRRVVRVDAEPSITLPVGQYQIRVTSPRCPSFEDKREMQRRADNSPYVLSVRFLCR